ncbi:MAG: PfkB family carbohydrate kinase, partial [Brevinema sp.]
IQNIIVSLGSEGAYLLSEDRIYFAKPLKGTLVSSVGAGDSLVAGFIGSYVHCADILRSFCYGIACGAGTAFSYGLTTKQTADTLFQYVELITIQ